MDIAKVRCWSWTLGHASTVVEVERGETTAWQVRHGGVASKETKAAG